MSPSRVVPVVLFRKPPVPEESELGWLLHGRRLSEMDAGLQGTMRR